MKKVLAAVAILLVLAALGLTGAGIALRRFLTSPQGDPSAPSTLLIVEPGANADQIARELEEAGLVKPAWLFLRILQLSGDEHRLQAGEYEVPAGLSPLQVLDWLREGRVLTVSVTVREGLDLEETAQVFADAGVAERDALLAAFRDPAPIADLDPAAKDLEGYLFPETYRFPRRAEPARVARRLVETFRTRFATPYASQIAGSRRTLREAVTLASLVEKETGLASERGRVAGVYALRLERGMRLQADPTVIYAMKLEGLWNGNIRRVDLERDHPYNTYTRAGLPPGPIASPGLPSLVAALHPAVDGSVFFVAKGDGSHAFSRTLAEHESHVRALRRAQAEARAARAAGSSSR